MVWGRPARALKEVDPAMEVKCNVILFLVQEEVKKQQNLRVLLRYTVGICRVWSGEV